MGEGEEGMLNNGERRKGRQKCVGEWEGGGGFGLGIWGDMGETWERGKKEALCCCCAFAKHSRRERENERTGQKRENHCIHLAIPRFNGLQRLQV